jgi:hypothetical protein
VRYFYCLDPQFGRIRARETWFPLRSQTLSSAISVRCWKKEVDSRVDLVAIASSMKRNHFDGIGNWGNLRRAFWRAVRGKRHRADARRPTRRESRR